LPIINKSKHPKKKEGGIQGIKGKDPPSKKTKEAPKEGKPPGNIKFLNSLPLFARSISNNERGGPLARMHNVKELSPTAITCLKIEVTWAHYNIVDMLCL